MSAATNSPTKGACCGPDSKERNTDASVQEKGRWILLDGMKTYVTGPANAKRAILFMYDILGLIPQSVHGCDLLAYSSNGPFFVVMPDWFKGHAAENHWLPPKTDEHLEKLQTFFDTTADVPQSLSSLQATFPKVRAMCPTANKWAIVGFCWGGKIAALASQTGTPFSVSVQSSPAWLDHKDAEKIVIPTGLMASSGEPRDEVNKYEEVLKVPNRVEYFSEEEHGWMTSRAVLTDDASISSYENGYKSMATFVAQYT